MTEVSSLSTNVRAASHSSFPSLSSSKSFPSTPYPCDQGAAKQTIPSELFIIIQQVMSYMAGFQIQ